MKRPKSNTMLRYVNSSTKLNQGSIADKNSNALQLNNQ